MSGKVRLDRWGPHLRAAKRAGKTLTQYAAEQGLSRHTLYAARQMLRTKGRGARARAAVPTQATSAFAEVKLVSARVERMAPAPLRPPSLRVQLPNGIALELSCEGTDAKLIVSVIDALVGRACSDSTPR